MSVLTNVESWIGKEELAIVTFFTNAETEIKKDAQAVAADFLGVLQWIEAHSATLAQTLASILPLVAALGTGIPAPVLAAAATLNGVTQLVNAALSAAQQAQGQGADQVTQAVAAGVMAYKGANDLKVSVTNLLSSIAGKSTPAAS